MIKASAFMCAGMILMYLLGAWVSTEFNPMEWLPFSRVFMVFTGILVGVALYGLSKELQ